MENKIYINASSFAQDTMGIEEMFSLKDLRRLDNFSKLALKAAKECLQNAGLSDTQDLALIISTGYGPVTRTCDFMNSIIDDGDLCASPLAFSSSVHNAALTYISMLLKIKGPCLTVSNMETSFESALNTAKTWLKAGMAKNVLVGAVEEKHSVVEKVLQDHPEVFKEFKDTSMQQGAAFFLLSNNEDGPEFTGIIPSATPINPSKDAFDLAAKHDYILSKHDVSTMVSDFIKTALARNGHDIMSVFETADIAPVFDKVGLEIKSKVFLGALLIFTKERDGDVNMELPLVDTCYRDFKKNQFVNFFTSGSTGIYKNCLHSADMIKEETHGLTFLFKDIKRIFCTVPVQHSYGFIFGLQMPKALRLPVIKKPPLPFIKWEDLLREGDLLIAFPMFLKQLIKVGFKFPKGVTVLSSTAPCPDDIIVSLKENGLENFIEIYGASEGGAIGYRSGAGEPFSLLPFWDVKMNGDNIEEISRKSTKMTIEMPDIVQVEADGRFRPVGRRDHAVQVAGINVFPKRVEETIKHYKAVKDAAVRLMRPDEGERLKAFIVLKPDYDPEKVLPELRSYLQSNLTVHEMPRSITFGEEVPVTDFGKKRDW